MAAGVGLFAQSTWSRDVGSGRAAAPVELLHATWCPKKIVPISNVPAQPRGDDADKENLRRAPDRARGARVARRNETGTIGRLPPDLKKAPPWSLRFEPNVELGGFDPMLAVGNKYLIVTQDHEIGFFDRTGKPLPGSTCVPKKLTTMAFFSAFWVPTNTDGSLNRTNINLQLGFPRNPPQTCDATKPSPSPPCVNEFYDTRVIFDRVRKRFVIAAAVRNGLWKGKEQQPTDALVRRYVAFAVSKTEDPRDGFHQYMTVATNYADFPRVVVNGGSLVIAHNDHDPGKPSAYVFDFDDLAAGKAQPGSFTYGEAQTGGRVVPVTDFTGTSSHTLFVTLAKADKNSLEIFAMPTVASYSSPPALLKTSVDLGVKPSSWSLGPVVRAGKVYLVSSVTITPRVPDVRPARLSVRMIRVPVEVSGSTLTASSSKAKGYLDQFFGLRSADDAPTDLVSYEVPGIAVNSSETIAFVYGRVGVETAKPLFPETRYSFWYKGETKQRGSKLLQKGEFQPTRVWVSETKKTAETFECEGCGPYQRVEYSTAVVDPTDDKTFWVVHEFADKDTNDWRTVVGKVKP